MSLTRRDFLARSTLALGAGTFAGGCRADEARPPASPRLPGSTILHDRRDWQEVRDQFSLSPDFIHMSALYVASHPKPRVGRDYGFFRQS